MSGSGKSTLAFDTIYSEGQRKYVESLSAYARQFLQMMNKPDVDSIEGLSPAISIEQKTTQKNPRSTVGTVTEIYDYLRVLFARVGTPYSPTTGLPIKSQTVSEITDLIIKKNYKNKIYILSPLVRDRKGEYKKELDEIKRKGYQRVKIDNEIYDIGIVLAECGEITAYYDRSQKGIFMCYEFINEIDALFYQQLNGDPGYIDETNRVIDFVFYHEVGHALIGVYELPTTGPEEDAADSFSSFVMADATSGTRGQDAIYSAATWFWLEHNRQGVSNSAFWDTHSLNIQRYYNISCFSYGSNPIYNQDLVDEGWLPPARAMWCDKEYTQQKNSWDEILQPFFK